MTYRPWTNRRVGIEMELNNVLTNGSRLDMRTLHANVTRAVASTGDTTRVVSVGYSHNAGDVWETKTDGSCGYEVTSPAIMLDDEGDNASLRAVCDSLKTLAPQINRQCGLHVHIEVRDFNWDDMRRLLALWSRYEPFFFEMLPASRRGNQYCMPIRKSTWAGPTNMGTWSAVSAAIDATTEREFQRLRGAYGRYHTLNLDNFWMSGRIEFRLHSGTVDYVKIRNWTKLLLALVARVKQPNLPRISKITNDDRAEGFNAYYVLKQLGLIRSKYIAEVPASNEALVHWVEARRQLFLNPTRQRGGRRGTNVASPERGETSSF